MRRNLYNSKLFLWMNTHDRMIVIILAFVTAFIWYLVEPIIFTFDSFAYLNSAKAILGQENSSYTYFRAPLLPLLLAVTKVPTALTFKKFIIVQLLLGISCIILLHSCLRRISSALGLIAILLLMSAFVGFVYSKSVMTEEIYLFGWCLCINGGLAYLSTPTRLRLFQITIALLILTLTRAQGVFISFVVLPFMMFSTPKHILEITTAGVILVLVTLGYSQWCASKAALIDDQKVKASISGMGITNTTGKMLFVTVYWDPYRRMNWTLVHPENGSATQRLFSELKKYYSIPSNLMAKADDPLFSAFANNPEGLIQTMEKKPDGQYWWAFWTVMDKRLGASAADKLLMDATMETILAHPFEVAFIYTRNFGMAFVSTTSSYVWAHPRIPSGSIGLALERELNQSGDCTTYTKLAKFLNFYFPAVQLILLITAIILSPRLWNSGWRTSWCFCIILNIYNHITVAVAAAPESRYIFYAFPILLVVVTMGLTLTLEKREYFPNLYCRNKITK